MVAGRREHQEVDMNGEQISRRGVFQVSMASLAAQALDGAPAEAWPLKEGPEAPKLCLELAYAMLGADPQSDAAARRILQLGLKHVLSGGPRIPWDEAELRARVEGLKKKGLTLWNLMIGGFPNTLYGRKGRDEEIEKVIQSVHVAGKVGVPVVEYNFYANRLTEGYYEQLGRGGAGMTAYDYERSKNLPALAGVGTHTAEECWANLTYFLKAVIPEAEKAGVKMALHPHDPPVPLSRGSAQIMSTLAGWKRLISIVDSPSNGITFDCGVTCELGEDPVEVCRYFGSRKRINHVHFRNVIVRKTAVDYTEVFPDEGQVDMFGVMKELVKQRYTGIIYPEHPRALDADRESPNFKPFYPGGGSYVGATYNIAYARAMLQAALGEV
jgi:mannonate dehydratase